MHYSAQDSKRDSRPRGGDGNRQLSPPLVAQIFSLCVLLWHSTSDQWRSPWQDWAHTLSLLLSVSSISSSPVSKWDGAEMHVLIHVQRIWGKRTEPRSCCFSSPAGILARLIELRQRAGSQIKLRPILPRFPLPQQKRSWFPNSEEVEVMPMTCLRYELLALSLPVIYHPHPADGFP